MFVCFFNEQGRKIGISLEVIASSVLRTFFLIIGYFLKYERHKRKRKEAQNNKKSWIEIFINTTVLSKKKSYVCSR